MGPRDGDVTGSPIKVDAGSLCFVAEILQSCPCPFGKPWSGLHSDGVIATEPLVQLL